MITRGNRKSKGHFVFNGTEWGLARNGKKRWKKKEIQRMENDTEYWEKEEEKNGTVRKRN